MTAQEIVARYYDAWQTKCGDLSSVPLADDFRFSGPVASFDSADGYRGMAREAGRAVTSFNAGRQFVAGSTVCSIIDWEMAIPGVGPMTSAELLEVENGGHRPRRAGLRRRGAAARDGTVGRMTPAANRTSNERLRW